MGFLSDAMSWLADTQATSDGESATYTRGATTLNITVILGSPNNKRGGENVSINKTDVDFLLDPSELTGLNDPLLGDRIVYRGKTYELALTTGDQCWEPSDGYGYMIRVHTRREV